MGIEIELGELLVVQLLATNLLAHFEIETSALRKIFKWMVIAAITVGLYNWLGHWAALFPVIGLIPGTIYHFYWCRKNGIDPFMGTPRRKYYHLRGWEWKE